MFGGDTLLDFGELLEAVKAVGVSVSDVVCSEIEGCCFQELVVIGVKVVEVDDGFGGCVGGWEKGVDGGGVLDIGHGWGPVKVCLLVVKEDREWVLDWGEDMEMGGGPWLRGC